MDDGGSRYLLNVGSLAIYRSKRCHAPGYDILVFSTYLKKKMKRASVTATILTPTMRR
jgi:hypothetical protein